jgi:hypothetical protein
METTRSAHRLFDEQATMTDKAVEEQLRQFIEGFATRDPTSRLRRGVTPWHKCQALTVS